MAAHLFTVTGKTCAACLILTGGTGQIQNHCNLSTRQAFTSWASD
jgi:hypothetical protein